MKIKLSNYCEELEKKLKKNEVNKELTEEVYTWILFFQHERLVHLIVTFMTAMGTILFLIGFLALESIGLFLLFLITLCLFIPYIFHYYYLENGTQKLYDLYFDIKKAAKLN